MYSASCTPNACAWQCALTSTQRTQKETDKKDRGQATPLCSHSPSFLSQLRPASARLLRLPRCLFHLFTAGDRDARRNSSVGHCFEAEVVSRRLTEKAKMWRIEEDEAFSCPTGGQDRETEVKVGGRGG